MRSLGVSVETVARHRASRRQSMQSPTAPRPVVSRNTCLAGWPAHTECHPTRFITRISSAHAESETSGMSEVCSRGAIRCLRRSDDQRTAQRNPRRTTGFPSSSKPLLDRSCGRSDRAQASLMLGSCSPFCTLQQAINSSSRGVSSRGVSQSSANSDRRYVPDLPPVFSHRTKSPMTMERSADLHMS